MTPTPPPSDRPASNDNDEITLPELIAKLRLLSQLVWRDRRYVWRSLALTIPLGLLVAFGSTPEYTASTKILPYRSTGNSSSGLSGLAGLAGIRLPAGSADPTITADLYPEVAKTLDFRIAVAETPIRFSTVREPVSTVKYFREVSRASVANLARKYTIGLPSLILTAVRPSPKQVALPDARGLQEPLAHYDPAYLGIVEELAQRLTVDIDRKTAIITIRGTMPDAYASANLVKVASERLMERIIDFESRKAGEQRRFVEEEQKRARERFEQSQRQLATFTDRNRGTLSATAQIEAQRLQSEYNLAFELYRQFSTEREQSRIKQNQDTPVFTVLEQVVVPNSRTSPRRSRDLLSALLLGVGAGLGIIWWRQYRLRQGSAAA